MGPMLSVPPNRTTRESEKSPMDPILSIIIVDMDPTFIEACRDHFQEFSSSTHSSRVHMSLKSTASSSRAQFDLQMTPIALLHGSIQQNMSDLVWMVDSAFVTIPPTCGIEVDLLSQSWERVPETFDAQGQVGCQYFEDEWYGHHREPNSTILAQAMEFVPFLPPSISTNLDSMELPLLRYRSVASLRRVIARDMQKEVCREVLLRLAPCDPYHNLQKGQSKFPQLEFWRDVNYGKGDPCEIGVRARLLRNIQDHDGVELVLERVRADQAVLPVRVICSDSDTFLVHGGMGLGMPGGIINQVIAAEFPAQFESIQQQMEKDNRSQGGNLCPTAYVGRIYISKSERTANVRLISCITFPRAHDEEMNVRTLFRKALGMVATESGLTSGNSTKVIRVVTHSLGAFHGHMEPWKFARGMADGLRDFLSGAIDY